MHLHTVFIAQKQILLKAIINSIKKHQIIKLQMLTKKMVYLLFLIIMIAKNYIKIFIQ